MTKKTYYKRESRDDFRDKLLFWKSAIDPRYLVESLGFSVVRETAKELRGPCKIHGGDNVTSFRFNKETRSWVCFSHKCHEIFGNDIIGLIKAAHDVEFLDAVDHLKNLMGEIRNDGSDYLKYKIDREKKEFINTFSKNYERPSIVSEEYLESFKPFRSNYFLDDSFTKETLDFFEVGGGYTDSYGYIRDVIPIRNDSSELVAYSLRDIRRGVDDDDFKYILTPGFDKDKVLYNLNNAKNYIQDNSLVVVEGFKSVWRCHQYGIYNVVAVMGSKLTQGQVNLLCSYPLKNVVLMFDNDIAGIEGTVAAGRDADGKLEIIPIFMTEMSDGKGLDPSDLTQEAICDYLKDYV